MSNLPERPAGRASSFLRTTVLRLYPPAWRHRYRDEVLQLLEDTGAGPVALLTLAWRALPAWLFPPRHLHDRDARVRASLGTVLTAGALLAGVGLVFAQLTQLQGFSAHGSPVIIAGYVIFDLAMACAGLAAAVGGLPLWVLMLRRARREHRSRETAYLLAPVAAPVAFFAGLVAITRTLGGPQGVSPAVFGLVVLYGFGAVLVSCGGIVAAMRRLRPRGPAVQLAVRAAKVATAAIVVAGGASVTALTGLSLWATHFTGHQNPVVLVLYTAVVAVLASAAISGTRRAASAS